jgi:hypothetical protein
VTHLFAILFFSGVLGMAVAALWSVFHEHRALVLAHMPWKERPTQGPVAVLNSVARNGLTC